MQSIKGQDKMTDNMPELNLYWDTTRSVDPSLAKRILAMFREYCNKIKVLPKLTIIHNQERKFTDKSNILWEHVDNAYHNHITTALELHNVDYCEILPIAHLISQINIKHNHQNGCCFIPDAFYLARLKEQNYTIDTMVERINSLRRINPNITFVFESHVDCDNCFDIVEFTPQIISRPFIDKWEIYRSTKNLEKLSNFLFYSFVRNNYGSKHFVSKNNIIVKDNEEKFIKIDFAYVEKKAEYRLRSNEATEYSRPLKEVSFEEALQDISFDASKIDTRDEKTVTENIVAKMESFFHLHS